MIYVYLDTYLYKKPIYVSKSRVIEYNYIVPGTNILRGKKKVIGARSSYLQKHLTHFNR